MRTIKFRAKTCKDDKWVYGSYLESNESWHGCKPHKSWIVGRVFSNGGWIAIIGRYPVKDYTVGQFTGLTDINGNEIYEGDIVQCGEFVYEVGYANRFASFVLLRKQDMFAHYFGEAMEANECEVIGNIYDNPELLEGDQECKR